MEWPLSEHREGSGGARNKILVKSGIDKYFREILTGTKKNGRRKILINFVRYQWPLQEKRARKICGSDWSLTIVGANVIILTGEKNVNKQI